VGYVGYVGLFHLHVEECAVQFLSNRRKVTHLTHLTHEQHHQRPLPTMALYEPGDGVLDHDEM
jgi:hypothetical protein